MAAHASAPTCRCLSCGAAPSSPPALRVLVGILSDPRSGARRRAAIRTSWLRWRGVGEKLLPCFALGSTGLARRKRVSFDANDVVWLNVEEIGVLSIPKVFAWWRAAASAMAHFTHAAKVDDDSFLHVPNLLNALAKLPSNAASAIAPGSNRRLATLAASVRSTARSPSTPLCFGPLAHAGYSPERFRMCGWSWQRGLGAWQRQHCGKRGFARPTPFPLGALQVLSGDLVRALGISDAVHAFADAANRSADLRKRDSNEDVALGYWIARLAGGVDKVHYVSVNDRAPNLGCFRNAGLYRQPRGHEIVIHRIKGARGMGYVWRMVHDGAAHDPIACVKEAEIELPRGSLIFTPQFEARVRAGTASVLFDQRTNKLSMVFHRPHDGPPHQSLAAVTLTGGAGANPMLAWGAMNVSAYRYAQRA